MTRERWAKEKTYPTISPVRSDWRKVSAIGAVALQLDETDSLETRAFFRLHPDTNIDSNLIRDFLHQVRLQVDGQITVLWDRASVHTANRIERFFERHERMGEIRMPTCCPELNPCEGIWDWSKTNDMENVTPRSFDELVSRTRSSLTKIQHRGNVRRWSYHQSEIELLS